MTRTSWLWLALAIGAVVAAPVLTAPAAAHQFAPALLALEETDAGEIAVEWKQPLRRVRGSRLQPVLPADCTGIGAPTVTREGTGAVARWRIACPGGLIGRSVGVDGIPGSRADVLLRIALADGRALQRLLTGGAPSFEVPAVSGPFEVAWVYGALGLEHIWTGWDHLLFVIALSLIVGWCRTLFWTITAFTLGHSVTLALAVLEVIWVPSAPVELAIALSIYVLAVELIARSAGRQTLTGRAPWAVAGLFGLGHGLGFAGALAEIGLPANEIPVSLASFNVGIEVGQIVVVVVVFAAIRAVRMVPVSWPGWTYRLPAYAIGSMAAFWVVERAAGMLGLPDV